jgi:hypothetical protein
MSTPAILYVSYGLPFKVSYSGSQPLYTLLSSSSQYSQLSIVSEIRWFHRMNLYISSLSTSFIKSKITGDALSVCLPILHLTPVPVAHNASSESLCQVAPKDNQVFNGEGAST